MHFAGNSTFKNYISFYFVAQYGEEFQILSVDSKARKICVFILCSGLFLRYCLMLLHNSHSDFVKWMAAGTILTDENTITLKYRPQIKREAKFR